MKQISILLASWFIVCTTTAQDFKQFEPLTCQGEIPFEVMQASSQKYQAEIEKYEKSIPGKAQQKNVQAFSIESNFLIDNLLRSGLVLFNDPVTEYLNEVVQEILRANPGFPKSVKVYTLRSPGVNAFATDRGTIFVTMGLLAQLENEAQLAFILCHELIHVREGHALDLYLEVEEIQSNSSANTILEKSEFDEQLVAKNRYSKELESESDEKGLLMFLKTDYSSKTLHTVFDVLKYAYLPFDEREFDYSILESPSYKIPGGYKLARVKAIVGENETLENDKSSHPNISARRKIMASTLASTPNMTGNDFLISKEKFLNLQKITRFELPMLYLHHQQNAEAVYASFLLLQKDPDNIYLKKCIAKALYVHAKLDSEGFSAANLKYKEMEGESQQLFFLLDTLPDKELTILALQYVYRLHLIIPEDKEVAELMKDLFTQMAKYTKEYSEWFSLPSLEAPDTLAQEILQSENPEPKEYSKYDRIKEKQGSNIVSEGAVKYYWQTAFSDYLNDEHFKEAFANGQKAYKTREEEDEYYEGSEGRKILADLRKSDRLKGKYMDIPKVVIVNPYYLSLDVRREDKIQYLKTESGDQQFNQIVTEMAKKSGLKAEILDDTQMKASDTDIFNEVRFLNDWFSEQIDYDDLPLTPGLNQAKIDSIADKYGTDYFVWTGVLSLRVRNHRIIDLVRGVFYPLFLPVGIYQLGKPHYEMLFYTIIFDVKSGRRSVVKLEYLNKKDITPLIKGHCYDAFLQIKSKAKKAR